ncbi:hypothetical protein WISP_85523 [Willisornis vidua]|uniref:Uncharacterized protein n=1 Tax=Willisornis vidua TaxID=1566151 RepID=A0ABQ9D450_9PASS|nr:hypothetical protein WISP_85523 [Willisornis vidua]
MVHEYFRLVLSRKEGTALGIPESVSDEPEDSLDHVSIIGTVSQTIDRPLETGSGNLKETSSRGKGLMPRAAHLFASAGLWRQDGNLESHHAFASSERGRKSHIE